MDNQVDRTAGTIRVRAVVPNASHLFAPGLFAALLARIRTVGRAVWRLLVALFGPTREYETAPLARSGRRAEVLTHPVWCRPCMLRECPIDHRCMKGIPPDRVSVALDRLMGSGPILRLDSTP